MYNWVEQLDLVCVRGEKIGLIGSMFFAGWSTTVLFIPFASDKIGRRLIFLISIICVALIMAGLLFSTSVNLTIALMFFEGALTSGRTMVGYVYINEFLTPSW